MSGEVSDESAQNIGEMLGAQSIVSGAVGKIGPLYRVQVKAIEVQTAGVQGQWSRNISSGATIAALTENYAPTSNVASVATAGGGKLGGTTQTAIPAMPPEPTAPPVPAEPPAPIYKIGSKGPAGGIVFYDKGNSSGGWRYLEAAPVDINRKVYGALDNINWQACSERAVGQGKRNTQAIMKEANFGWAAQMCDALVVNDFDDWFLPSRDELSYMYGNLHLQGVGNFENANYWSSTSNHPWGQFWCVNFSDGEQDTTQANIRQLNVRACRQF